MKGTSFLAWTQAVLIIGAVLLVAWLVWRIKTSAGEALESAQMAVTDAIEAIDPSNSNNIFKQGADTVISRIAGRDETLGGWLYSIIHRDPVEEQISQKLEENPWNYRQEFTP